MHNGLDEPARLEADDRHAGGRCFQRRYAQPLRQRRMGEDVEAADVIIEVFAEPGEGDDVRDAEGLRLRLQLVVEVAFAENEYPVLAVRRSQFGSGLQQVAMTLARYQLPGRCNQERIIRYSVLLAKSCAVASSFEVVDIDRAADDGKPLFLDTPVAQLARDGIRNRDDLSEWPVAKRRDEAHFRVVDPSRHHGRHVRKARGETAEHVRAAAAVAMHDVRFRLADELCEPIGERQVEISGTEQVPYRYGRRPRRIVDAGSWRAHDQVVVTHVAQCLHEVNDLLRATIEMAPGFDMQYFHRREE